MLHVYSLTFEAVKGQVISKRIVVNSAVLIDLQGTIGFLFDKEGLTGKVLITVGAVLRRADRTKKLC